MDITMLLAQIWGPIILAIGVGVFLHQTYYTHLYRGFEKDAFALMFFGVVAMAVGIVHVQVQSEWHALPQIIVSLLGWALLLKGILFIVAPHVVDRIGDSLAHKKYISSIGVLTLLVGAYLSWFGYIA